MAQRNKGGRRGSSALTLSACWLQAGGKDGESSFDLAAVEDAVKLVKRGLQHKNHTVRRAARAQHRGDVRKTLRCPSEKSLPGSAQRS